MGDVFPELKQHEAHIRDTIAAEEASFGKTLVHVRFLSWEMNNNFLKMKIQMTLNYFCANHVYFVTHVLLFRVSMIHSKSNARADYVFLGI